MAAGTQIEPQGPIDLILNLVRRLRRQLINQATQLGSVISTEVFLGEFGLPRRGERLDFDDEMVRAVPRQVQPATIAPIPNHPAFASVNAASFVRVSAAAPVSMDAAACLTPWDKSAATPAAANAAAELSRV